MSVDPIDIDASVNRALRRNVRLPELSQPVYIESAHSFMIGYGLLVVCALVEAADP